MIVRATEIPLLTPCQVTSSEHHKIEIRHYNARMASGTATNNRITKVTSLLFNQWPRLHVSKSVTEALIEIASQQFLCL